jgi:predicted Zn-dependent protease
MLDLITGALGRQSGVSDWTVRRRHSRSVQLYLIGRSIENVREVETEEYDLDVYNDHPFPSHMKGAGGEAPSGSARGAASIKLVPADKPNLKARIEDAVTMASLTHNRHFALPESTEYPDVPLADPSLAHLASSREAAGAFADEIWGLVEREDGIRLSAAELFLTVTDVELWNSRGVRAGSSGTRVLSEIVLLARGEGADEAEHFRQLESRRLVDLRLEHNVPEAARFARDTLRSRAPKTRTGPVVLTGEALITLFEAFTFQASARAAYMKLTSLEPGQSVLGDREAKGDLLTLRSNALREFAIGSHRFDGDGVPGQDVLLIENGVLRQRIAGQRYGQYLGVPITGEAGTTEVGAGTTPLPQLLRGDGPVLHVVKFSSPEVDPVTGDFGSEIRLAYEVNGDSVEPVKGGSVSGNVFDAFADAQFSSDTTSLIAAGFSAGGGDYFGPEAIRFASLRIAGE